VKAIAIVVLLNAAIAAWAADEIQISARLKVDNGDFSAERQPSTIKVDQTTLGADSGIQIIGTNWEAVTVGDLSVYGWAQFRNTDTTDSLYLAVVDASTNYHEFAELEAGEPALFRLFTNVTLYAKAASTNSVKLDKLMLED